MIMFDDPKDGTPHYSVTISPTATEIDQIRFSFSSHFSHFSSTILTSQYHSLSFPSLFSSLFLSAPLITLLINLLLYNRELLLKIQPPIFPEIDKNKIKVEQFHNATSNRVFKCSFRNIAVMVRIHGEGRERKAD
jgi:hypothetical protein